LALSNHFQEAKYEYISHGRQRAFRKQNGDVPAQRPDVKTVVSLDLVPPKEWFVKSIEKYTKKFHYVRGSVAEIEDLLNTMRTYKIDRVINWAFIMIAANAPTDPRLAVKVNVMGMSNAFEAAKIMDVNRVVYASSETVYGPQAQYGMREVTRTTDQSLPFLCRLQKIRRDTGG